MAAKITLGIIARNAAGTIEKCLVSAAPYVDEIIVGFGGESSDDTEGIVTKFLHEWWYQNDSEAVIKWERMQDRPEPPYQTLNIDWRDDFSRARNEVLDRATGDFFLWLDADDELINGDLLRQYIEQHPEANCFWAPYHYDEDEHGNVSTYLWRERLVRDPAQWRWEGAIHEFLVLNPSVPLAIVQMPDVVVKHQPGRNKVKGTRNLDILYRELAASEPDPSQRLLFYLFRENASRGNLSEALLHANRYVSRAQFDDEAYQMAFGVADTLRALGRREEARKAALKAMEINSTWPDAWFLMARLAYEDGRFTECIEWTKAGSTKEPPSTSVIIDPRTYSYWPYFWLGAAYRAMGDWEMAAANFEIAARVSPDEQIYTLLAEAQEAIDGQKVMDAFFTVHEHLGRNDEWLKARNLFKVAPKALEKHPAVVAAMQRTMASTAHVENPQVMVDFYRDNPRWEPMSDEVLWSDGWQQHPRMKFARKSITCDPPATILDLGSSDGFISLPLAKDGHVVEGWDLDPRCVDLANKRAQEAGLRASYHVGSIDDVEGKYDVALALEVIEHLVDPKAFLDKIDQKARKVVLTTPYLAWERGRVADWEKVEPKSHLRIYDLDDLEAKLLAGRGRIFDLHHEPWPGANGWIFASYRPRQSYNGTISFVAPGTLEEWSPKKLEAEGLGGSETALIRLAEELFLNDSKLCTVYGRIDSPGYYNGVRYRPMDAFDPRLGVDTLVAWRYPELADLPLRSKRLVLWMHDTDAGSRLTPVRAARFDHIVVLSEWHRTHMIETYPWLDPEKLVIIGNGVDVERFESRGGNHEPHRVAYTSSPDRGLDVVLEHVWPKVVEQVPDAELHVYYGWNNFDALKDAYPHLAEFRQKVANLLIDSKNVVQHGRIAQGELARELQRASVWLYPSHNFDETYCISAVEAQLAGAIPVTSNRGALSETVGGGVVIEGTIGENGVAEQYIDAVVALLSGGDEVEERRSEVRDSAPAKSWTEISDQWMGLLSQ